jgi:periplasmic copper chaperone A
MKTAASWTIACALAAAVVAPAGDVRAQPVAERAAAAPTIVDPWIRSTRPGQQNAAGYFRIRVGAADRLIDVKAPPEVAERTELHTMRMDRDLMVMRQVDGFDVRPGRGLVLQPGGNHLMLIGLKRPLQIGDTVAVVLVFEKAGEVPVRMTVLDGAPAAAGAGASQRSADGAERRH